MFADLNMLMDLFIRRNPLRSQFLIKTHPHQIPFVQFFIEHYTKLHPTVSIAAKGTHYLAVGEYEVHFQKQSMSEVSAKRRECVPHEAANDFPQFVIPRSSHNFLHH